jgi:uncharacterized protein YlzI (FlbEa/FlbD family)
MAKLIEFEEVNPDGPVQVSASNVKAVRPNPDEPESSIIEMMDGSNIVVYGDHQDVANKLNANKMSPT